MDKIFELFNKANITLFLSIIGSIGTLSTFVISFLNKRKKLHISVSNVSYSKEQRILFVPITFENRSQLPIAVTDVILVNKGHQYFHLPYPRQVSCYTHTIGNEVVDRINTYNANLPIDISQLSAKSGYFLFDIPTGVSQTLETDTFLLIHSTRGKVMKIELLYTP